MKPYRYALDAFVSHLGRFGHMAERLSTGGGSFGGGGEAGGWYGGVVVCTVCTSCSPLAQSAVTLTSYPTPGVRPFRSKTVDVAGSEMSPGADPMPRVGSVLICRSWTEHVFGRPVIVPLQAEDPPTTVLSVVHGAIMKVGESTQVAGCVHRLIVWNLRLGLARSVMIAWTAHD